MKTWFSQMGKAKVGHQREAQLSPDQHKRGILRLFLAGGSSTLLLAACEDMPPSAVAAWADSPAPPSADPDPRVRALAWAMLAPNPHNLQAWLADLRRPGEIELLLDPARLLPATDPHGRQVLIGAGAFLELLVMAAAADGLHAEVEYFPAGEFGPEALPNLCPLARVRLRADAQMRPDPLFAYARARRSNRSVYSAQLASAVQIAALERCLPTSGSLGLGSSLEPAMVARLNALAMQACRLEFSHAPTWAESARSLRLGAAEVAMEPSGTALLGHEVWWGRKVGLLNRAALLDPAGPGPARAMEMMQALFESEGKGGTSAWVWLSSADNSRPTQIEVGRSYLRLNLQTTALGLALHPCSQLLQEFALMRPLFGQLHAQVGVAQPARLQMLARIGFAPSVAPSARRPVQQVLRLS